MKHRHYKKLADVSGFVCTIIAVLYGAVVLSGGDSGDIRSYSKEQIGNSTRIGVREEEPLWWRWFVLSDPNVSKHKTAGGSAPRN